jgi:hypothetical protein
LEIVHRPLPEDDPKQSCPDISLVSNGQSNPGQDGDSIRHMELQFASAPSASSAQRCLFSHLKGGSIASRSNTATSTDDADGTDGADALFALVLTLILLVPVRPSRAIAAESEGADDRGPVLDFRALGYARGWLKSSEFFLVESEAAPIQPTRFRIPAWRRTIASARSALMVVDPCRNGQRSGELLRPLGLRPAPNALLANLCRDSRPSVHTGLR